MRTMTLVMGPEGRVKIPGPQAGQAMTMQLEPEIQDGRAVAGLSSEEQERVIQALLAGGQRVREAADPEWLNLDHGEWLYGPDGLPK